jgi:hypothetical protein
MAQAEHCAKTCRKRAQQAMQHTCLASLSPLFEVPKVLSCRKTAFNFDVSCIASIMSNICRDRQAGSKNKQYDRGTP